MAIVVLLVLFIALPTSFKGTSDLDTRFIVMAAFVVPAALVPVALPGRAVAWVNRHRFHAAVQCAHDRADDAVWHDWATELAAFRTVIAQMSAG